MKVYKEENDTNLNEIRRAEKIWKTKFPKEYVDFLIKYNGLVTYPNYPTISVENNSTLWAIERFLSIGDIILQKQYPMSFSLYDIEKEDLKEYNLKAKNLLTFAIGERGSYFMDLAPRKFLTFKRNNFGQIYFCNFSGGDGIVRTNTNSFAAFIDSLDYGDGHEYDPDFKLTKLGYSSNKIFQSYLFNTPNNPQLGLSRFKEVFQILGDIQPPENGYPNIIQKYVHDRLKLDYLLENGCSTDGLLRYARNAETIKYLVEEKRLDINKKYKGRYPLQNYLTPTSTHDVKVKYELITKLLEMGIEIDWSIKETQLDGKSDLTMIEKLEALHMKYLEYETYDKNRWIKSGKPNGYIPFIRSKLIEKKLGIRN